MKFDYVTIILVIASLGIGYYLNTIANEQNNKKLIASFKEELEAINNNKSRATPGELIMMEQQEQIINAKINLLEQL